MVESLRISLEVLEHPDHAIKPGTGTQQRERDQEPRIAAERAVGEISEDRAGDDRPEKLPRDRGELAQRHDEGHRRPAGIVAHRSSPSSASSAASAKASISTSVCAAETKAASSCAGGR